MSFSIKIIQVGPIDVNCYILKDDNSSAGLVIDPGGNPERIMPYIVENGIDVKMIVNTHGHWDHIGAVDELRELLEVKLAIHRQDADMLTSARGNLSAFMGANGVMKPAEVLLENGDTIEFGSCKLKVIHTPGHTVGGICLYDGADVLFSGDTLFYGSVGRTDFPGGSMQELIKSIRNSLAVVADSAVVYPGHGPATNMGEERRSNPYL